MLESFLFWGIVLAILATFLAVNVGRRYRETEAKERALERQIIPTAFDASTIAPKIERVRREYLSTPHLRTRPTGQPLRLLAAARQIVANLSYFRARTTGNEQ